ncbi:MAG: DUF5050 domain-containing protein [bacterium]|nr:DUF5050 domain-containing protein [bacterium]
MKKLFGFGMVLGMVFGAGAGDAWGKKEENLRQGLFAREKDREERFSPDEFRMKEPGKKAKRSAGSIRKTFSQAQTGTKLTNHQLNISMAALPNNSILFLSDRDGQFDLYKMGENGSNKTRLTNDSYLEFEVYLSPSGEKIAYIAWDSACQFHLYVMNLNGLSKIKIASSSNWMGFYGNPWSPNSEWLIYYDEGNGIWSVKADESGSKNKLGDDFRGFTWSPDGAWIAYCHNDWQNQIYGIYKIAPTGGTPIAITTSTTGWFYNLTFSPNGNWIVYSYDVWQSSGIYKIASTGGTPIAIITSTTGWCYNPTFSPNGNYITYCHNDWQNNIYSLYTIDLQGGTSTQINTSTSWLGDFSWSPNSVWILYEKGDSGLWSAKPDGTQKNQLTQTSCDWAFFLSGSSRVAYTNFKDIYTISTTGGNPTNLTNNPYNAGINTEPLFSPDGSKIAYISIPNKDATAVSWGDGLWVMDKNGGNKREIGTITGWWKGLVWSPDGDWIGYCIGCGKDRGIYKISTSGGTPVAVMTMTTGYISDFIWPKNDWIVYSYDDWQSSGIYKVALTGGTLTAITNFTTRGLTSSPNGDWIAFIHYNWQANERYIYKLPFAGGTPTALASSTTGWFDAPAWSPNGDWIAYVCREGATSTIMLLSANGSEPQVVHTTDKWIERLCWSPDSTKVGFSDGFNTYYINIAGSGLTKTNAGDTFSSTKGKIGKGIDWSADSIIAYNQNLDIYINQSVPAEKPVLFVSPQSLSFSTKVGQNPGTQTIEVRAIGGVGSLSWTASSNQTWLSVSPVSGNTPATLTISANAQDLPAGYYQARAVIESQGAAEGSSPKAVLVNLLVRDPQVDVEVIKTAPHNIEASTFLTYKIFAINRGADDASSVIVTDELPLSASYTASSPSGSYNPASRTVTWNIGTLTKNSFGSMSLVVFIPGTVTGGIVNTVRITTTSTETTYVNNSYTHRAGVVSQTGADLSVSKSATGETAWVKRGFKLYYNIYYSNYGLRPATNTTITDTLPKEVTYISSDGGGTYNATNHTVIWQIGTLPSYEWGYRKICVNIPTATTNGAELINRVSIQTDTPETEYNNNSFTQSVIVGAAIDPNDKSVYPQGDIQGTEQLSYTIRYENIGSVPTTFIKVEDILDSNLDEGSLIIGGGGTYDTSTRKIIWIDTVSLDPGSENTRAVSFTVYPKQGLIHGAEIKNKATIYFDHESVLATNEVVSKIIRFAGDNNKVIVYPNPYKKGDAKFGGDIIWFKDVSSGSTIKVYTIAGELVDEIKVTVNPQSWKISDKKIASGVYIYTVTGGSGGKSVGKIGIIK